MTTRDLGFAVLKFMGLIYLVSAIFNFVSMVGWLTTSPSEAWPSPETFAASAFVNLFVYTVLSFCCLFFTKRIATWLFGEELQPTLAINDPDRFLTVGVILIGVALLGSNLAITTRFAFDLLLNLEGSRRPILGDFLRRTWYESGPSIGTAILGAFLIVRGSNIAQRLSPWREAENEQLTEDEAS